MPVLERSYLYVPGDRPDRFASALRRQADAVIVDLEDSVRPDARETARSAVSEWLNRLRVVDPKIWVRINSGDQRGADLAAVAGSPAVAGLVVAKTETRDELDELDKRLTAMGSGALVAPLVESATGLEAIQAIARGPRVHVLHLGEVDLAADLDVTVSPDGRELAYARSRLVIAARAADLAPPVAPVGLEMKNLIDYERETYALRRMGFFGRACVHPVQVDIANRVHLPTTTEIEWAEDVLRRAAETSSGAFVDSAGTMVDEAVLRRARRISASVTPNERQ